MKKLIYVMVILLFVGCSTDDVVTGKEFPSVDLGEREKISVGYNEDGSIVYAYSESKKELERRSNTKGKGKPDKVALLTLPQGQISTNAVINIMRDPVEYLGELPTDDNGGLVDWDGDGQVDDLIVLEERCYFPRTFTDVVCYLNGTTPQVINNSIAFNAQLLGFSDVDNDGDQDIIWQGGNHYLFNQGETYSPYNVGLNELAEEPTPLATSVSQLVLTESVNNPDYIRWDLGSEYEGYVFHVRVSRFEQLNDSVPQTTQTHTYGDWGIYAPSMLQGGGLFEIEFTNLGEDCTPITIDFNL